MQILNLLIAIVLAPFRFIAAVADVFVGIGQGLVSFFQRACVGLIGLAIVGNLIFGIGSTIYFRFFP